MASTDPGAAGPPRIRGGSRTWTLALAVTVLILIVTSFINLRKPARRSGLDAAQVQVESLYKTRALYSLRSNPEPFAHSAVQSRSREVIADLKRLADRSAAPRSIRRLALTQYVFADPGWRDSLLRLRSVPHSGPTFDTERELSRWGQVLGGTISPAEVPADEYFIRSLNLGWYEHLALEALYRRAGRNELADREVALANSSTSRLLTVVNLGFLAGLTGVVLIGGQAVAGWEARKRRKMPDTRLPVLPPIRPVLPPLSREQADVLYNGFILYLASFAVVRLALGPVLGQVTSALTGDRPSEAILVLQMFVSVVTALPALLWLIMRGRRVGLEASHVGLTARNLPRNIAWGIAGYAAALPLVYLSSVISTWLFRGVESPPHPVIAEIAGTRGPVYLALMFAQVAILPPLVEELMFRGVFFRSLTVRMSVPAAVVVASVLFAVLHPQLPLGFLGIFVLGMIFNGLLIHRGSLVPGMVAHGLNNGVIFIIFVLLTAN
jgi:membrane protease YdiL (CAAX protease family)